MIRHRFRKPSGNNDAVCSSSSAPRQSLPIHLHLHIGRKRRRFAAVHLVNEGLDFKGQRPGRPLLPVRHWQPPLGCAGECLMDRNGIAAIQPIPDQILDVQRQHGAKRGTVPRLLDLIMLLLFFSFLTPPERKSSGLFPFCDSLLQQLVDCRDLDRILVEKSGPVAETPVARALCKSPIPYQLPEKGLQKHVEMSLGIRPDDMLLDQAPAAGMDGISVPLLLIPLRVCWFVVRRSLEIFRQAD